MESTVNEVSSALHSTLSVALLGVAGAIGILMLLMMLTRFLYVCRPSEILIFSGRKHRLADGSEVGSRVIFGGRAWRIPLIESVQRMKMLSMPIDVQVQGAYTKVGIPLKVRAIAVIKLSSDPNVVMNAIERFLGRGLADVQQVAKETLEGNLRGVLAAITPEEVNEDQLKFADSLAAEVERNLTKLGLHLDVAKIQHVTDDANYLASIRPRAHQHPGHPRRRDRRVERAQRGRQGGGRRRDARQGRRGRRRQNPSCRRRTSCGA